MAQTQRDFDALAIRELGACHDDGSWLWQPPAVSGAKPARRKAVVCKRARSDTSDDWSPLPGDARPAAGAADERGDEVATRRAARAHVRGVGGRPEALGPARAPAARRKVHIADVYFAEELHAALHDGTSHQRARPPAKSQQHARRDERARPAADALSEEPLYDSARTMACGGSPGGRPADGTAGKGGWLLYTDAAHLLLDAVGIQCHREGSEDFALRF